MGFKCQQNFSHPVGLPTPRHVFSFPFHGLFTSSLLLFEKFKGKAEIQASRAGRMNLQLNNSEITLLHNRNQTGQGLDGRREGTCSKLSGNILSILEMTCGSGRKKREITGHVQDDEISAKK